MGWPGAPGTVAVRLGVGGVGVAGVVEVLGAGVVRVGVIVGGAVLGAVEFRAVKVGVGAGEDVSWVTLPEVGVCAGVRSGEYAGFGDCDGAASVGFSGGVAGGVCAGGVTRKGSHRLARSLLVACARARGMR